MTRMTTAWILTLALTAATSTATVMARQQGSDQKSAGPLTGRWTMTVDSPHGQIPMTLALSQDGKNVKGTITSGMGERPVKGEYAEAALTLATTDDAANEWTVAAKLTTAGALQGHLSASAGDMKFTAEKAKEQK